MSELHSKKNRRWGIAFIIFAVIPYSMFWIDPIGMQGDEINVVFISNFFLIIAALFIVNNKARSPHWCWLAALGFLGVIPVILLKNRDKVWNIYAEKEARGPFSYLELQTGVQNGEIKSDSVIGKQGKSKKKPITKVFPQLFFDEIPSLRLRRRKVQIFSSVAGVLVVAAALVAGFFFYAFSEEGQFVQFRFPPYLPDDLDTVLYHELEPLLILAGEHPECSNYLDSNNYPEWNYSRGSLEEDPRKVLLLQNAADHVIGDTMGLAKAHAKYLLSEYYRFKKVFGFYNYSKFAHKLLEEAAAEGSIYAQLELADKLRYSDKEDAASTRLKYYRMAADKGCYQACLFVGLAFCEGDVVPPDAKLGREYFTKALESKLFIGHLSSKEFARARSHLVQMAEAGDAAAQKWVGGLVWLERSAEQNNSEAQYQLGINYFYGFAGLEKDVPKGLELLTTAAQNGSASAQEQLGSIYISGLFGFEKNESLALKYLSNAALGGHLDAQKELSDFYYDKALLTKDRWDYFEAAKWLEQLWNNGEVSVLPKLQWCMVKSEHWERVFEYDRYYDAYKYLRMTARYESKAQYLLGWMLLNGKGVDRDLEGAIAWLKKSAINGNYPDAQHLLSSCYKEGIGVLEDYRESYAWSVICAKNGGDSSMKDFLQKELSMSQVTDGQARAKELLAEIESANKKSKS